MSTDEISSTTRLGFIGLGYLGSRIARRLIAAGFPVTVYDRNQAKAAQFSAGDEDVYFGTGKALRAARRVNTIIELSTTLSGYRQASSRRGSKARDFRPRCRDLRQYGGGRIRDSDTGEGLDLPLAQRRRRAVVRRTFPP
jgi:hypothetical protein